MSRFRAFLADAGGTLFPDQVADPPAMREVRAQRLAAVLPELDASSVARLLAELTADAKAGEDRLEQRTEAAIAARLSALDGSFDARVPDVRRALTQPTGHEPDPFPGHRDLLLTAGRLGLRRVLVSNTAWISELDWWGWRMERLSLVGLLEGVVTSYDLGWRKPHRAMFERAQELAGCAAQECVFIGDNERKDVEPALALGMTVIRVAIQEPPAPTRAHRLVTSLPEASQVLRSLCQEVPAQTDN
ncbi:MAG TPA: HAD family hydrolase [Candidatus Dormibacteraeota bacterium]|nr:HAD family hydrolase [Candidatus Dormibacteraeota bacterium]